MAPFFERQIHLPQVAPALSPGDTEYLWQIPSLTFY